MGHQATALLSLWRKQVVMETGKPQESGQLFIPSPSGSAPHISFCASPFLPPPQTSSLPQASVGILSSHLRGLTPSSWLPLESCSQNPGRQKSIGLSGSTSDAISGAEGPRRGQDRRSCGCGRRLKVGDDRGGDLSASSSMNVCCLQMELLV